MKYLSHYIQDLQTAAFEKHGAFFAFSQDQFNEQKQEGITYISLGAGMLCPKENAQALCDELDTIHANGIKADLAENGKAGVIERELHNHEAFYVGNIEDTVDALQVYGITAEEVLAEYRRIAPTIDY